MLLSGFLAHRLEHRVWKMGVYFVGKTEYHFLCQISCTGAFGLCTKELVKLTPCCQKAQLFGTGTKEVSVKETGRTSWGSARAVSGGGKGRERF